MRAGGREPRDRLLANRLSCRTTVVVEPRRRSCAPGGGRVERRRRRCGGGGRGVRGQAEVVAVGNSWVLRRSALWRWRAAMRAQAASMAALWEL